MPMKNKDDPDLHDIRLHGRGDQECPCGHIDMKSMVE